MTKVFKFGFIAIFFVILLLLLLPWLFKDEIFQKVKDEANNNLKGELFIEDLSLSLFKDFPNLSLTLNKMRYEGEAPFEGVELFNIDEMSAELDIMSVIKGETIEIKKLTFQNAKIDVKVLADGRANYLIMKEDEADETVSEDASSPFHMTLQKFSIDGLNLIYDDAESEIFTQIADANFTLKGDFTEKEVAIETQTFMTEFTVAMEDLTYLNKVKVDAEVNAIYNQETGRITLNDNKVSLNNLLLAFAGWAESYDEKVSMDLTYEAPNSDFKEVLSLVPASFMEGYEAIQTSGKFTLKGNAIGDYFYEGDNLPGFEVALKVSDGNFKYPDLPSSVSDIQLEMGITHKQGPTDFTVVAIPNSSMNIAGSPFKFTMLLKTPMSDPDFDVSISTKLNLKKVTEAVPVEGSSFDGILLADAHVKGRLSQFENEEYDKVEATGYFNTKNLRVKTEDLKEEVRIDTAYIAVTPQKFDMPILKMKLGKSDFEGAGSLRNMLGYVFANDTIRGNFTLSSTLINATELMAMMPEEEASITTTDSTLSTGAPAIPGNINMSIVAKATTLLYDDMTLENMAGVLLIKNSVAYLKGFTMDLLQGKLLMDGNYTTNESGKGLFDMDLEMKGIDTKTAFETFNTVQSFAPIAKTTTGQFSTKMTFKGSLTDDMMPDLNTLIANGNLKTLGMLVQPEIMGKVAAILKDDKYKSLKFKDADLSFEIKDGRVAVSPIKMLIGDLNAEFSGSQGLDQSLDYILKSEISTKNIDLPAELKALNINTDKIPVQFKIGGTFTNPTVKPVFGDGGTLKDVVKDVVNKAVAVVKDSAINVVNNEAAKIMADARAQADKIMADAERQANKIKAEASKQAEAVKAEAKTQYDNLMKEAGNDPIKKLAAKKAGEKLISEADKQANKLQSEANKQADVLVQNAKNQSDKIMADAEAKAKINK